MKTTLTFIITVVSAVIFAQNSTVLDQNNVGTFINTNGLFFNNPNGTEGYVVPNNSSTGVINSSSFWFGGIDSDNTLHLAATIYGTNNDYFCGPISTDYTHSDYLNLYEGKFWKITKTEINNHISNYQQPSYVMPTVITEWPANGQSSLGVANDLAPYIDINNNGTYDPENGDYPNIRGDMAVYIIMNDGAEIHTETGGEKLGMEFHYMFYQFSSNDYKNNMTFINLKVINRSVNTYSDFKVGYYVDHDIGYGIDDYVGCSPIDNLMFGYNSGSIDGESTIGGGFGNNPPALGVKLLNHNLDIFSNVTPNIFQPGPVTAAEYWNLMNAKWHSGLPFTYGGSGINGTFPTNYMYPGSLTNSTEWSQVSENSTIAFSRMLGITEAYTIHPNQSICYDYAILYNSSGGTNIDNAVGLTTLSTQVQSFFDNQTDYNCQNIGLGTMESKISNFEMYPNPSIGELNLSSNSIFDVTIYSINGEVVYSNSGVNFTLKLNLNVSNGIYFVKVTQDNSTFTQKLIIK
jgi:hypothetical protein